MAQTGTPTPQHAQQGAPQWAAPGIDSPRWWRQAPTRTEALLFGLLILAIVVLLVAPREKTVFVVPAPPHSAHVVIT